MCTCGTYCFGTQDTDRTFITFHDNKPLEGHITEKPEDFNIKVNTTISTVLNWVSGSLAIEHFVHILFLTYCYRKERRGK